MNIDIGYMDLDKVVLPSYKRGPFKLYAGNGVWLDMLLTAEEERGMDPDLIFEESVLVKPRYAVSGRVPGKLIIINRYRYSEYDTLTLDNYRISCEATPGRKGALYNVRQRHSDDDVL